MMFSSTALQPKATFFGRESHLALSVSLPCSVEELLNFVDDKPL